MGVRGGPTDGRGQWLLPPLWEAVATVDGCEAPNGGSIFYYIFLLKFCKITIELEWLELNWKLSSRT